MISLHAPTISAMLIAIAFATGFLLLLSWLQNRSVVSPALWGLCNILGGIAAALYSLRDTAPDFLTIDLANAIMLFAFGLGWAGMRRFAGRQAPVFIIVAPALIWLLLCRWDAFYASLPLRVVVACSVMIGFTLGAVLELGRLKEESLVSRYPTMVWLLWHALCVSLRAPMSVIATTNNESFVTSPLLTMALFEGVLNMVVFSFLQIALVRERAENLQREAAMTDLLTAAPNRRALFQNGPRILAGARASGRPVSCLVIDIDHFKRVNDCFGHDGGDAVLIAVADAMRTHLRSADYFARLGGEEFVCLLPDTSLQVATMVAEGLRARVASLRPGDGERDLRISVSIGVACATDATIDDLLREADRNLYEAKASGRDRVAATAAQPRGRLRVA